MWKGKEPLDNNRNARYDRRVGNANVIRTRSEQIAKTRKRIKSQKL